MLLNLLWNFGHQLMHQWVETTIKIWIWTYSCNICLGTGREYGNSLYGLYEKILLWADWGWEIREFIEEQVIVYGKVLFQKLYPYYPEHIFSPPRPAALFSVWLWSPSLQYYVRKTNTDCAGESSGSKANWNLYNLHFRVEIVKCKAIYCNFTFRSLREKVWVANL